MPTPVPPGGWSCRRYSVFFLCSVGKFFLILFGFRLTFCSFPPFVGFPPGISVVPAAILKVDKNFAGCSGLK